MKNVRPRYIDGPKVTYLKGDILHAEAEAVVCPVNCVGVMGAGLALQFRDRFPDYYKAYKEACRSRDGPLRIGRVWVYGAMPYAISYPDNPYHIISFPTKRHYRDQSNILHIQSGLISLQATTIKLRLRSIAIPPIGCGLGGLDYERVRQMVEEMITAPCLEELQMYVPTPPKYNATSQ